MFLRWSIKRILGLGFIGVLVATLVVVGIAVGHLHSYYKQDIESANELIPKIILASKIDTGFNVRNSNIRGYIVTGKDVLRRRYEVADVETKGHLTKLKALPQTGSDKNLVATVGNMAEDFDRHSDKALSLLNAGNRKAAFQLQQSVLEPLTQEIAVACHEYSDASEQMLKQRLAELDLNVRATYVEMLIAVLIAICITGVFILTTTRAIGEPVRKLMMAAESLENGNYEASEQLEGWRKRIAGARGHGSNEILHLASAFGSMASSLRQQQTLLEKHNKELQDQNEEILVQSEELGDLNRELNILQEETEAALALATEKGHELSVLGDVGRAITASLEFDDLVATIEVHIKDLLDADASSIMLFDKRRQELFISGGKQLSRQHPVAEHVDQCEGVASRVARTGKAAIVAEVPNCGLCKYQSLACNDNGTHHMLSVPMLHKGQTIGTINAFRRNKPVFNESDMKVLSTLANAAAVAFENSRIYEREHRIAEKLQMSFLPRDSFDIPGFTVGCKYNPATEESKVGGDFYDVIDIGDGRVTVVMGDVSGKGVDAAIYTAIIKYMLRGFTLSNPDPCDAMSKLNDAFHDMTPPEVFVTLFIGVLDVRKKEMVYVNAGHDQPLFYSRSEGSCSTCEVTGRALGMLQGGDYTSDKISFQPGDMVVMYTDGITDARNGKQFLGIDGLDKLVCIQSEGDACDIVSNIFREVKQFAGQKLHDDAAVLVIKALVD